MINKVVIIKSFTDFSLEELQLFSDISALIQNIPGETIFAEENDFKLLKSIISTKEECNRNEVYEAIAKLRDKEWQVVFDIAQMTNEMYRRKASFHVSDAQVYVLFV